MKKIRFSNRFKKELRLMKKRGKNTDKFNEVMSLLSENKSLPERLKDHQLKGNFVGCRDCHLEPDWLLIYRLAENVVIFERTGTHSDLFQK